MAGTSFGIIGGADGPTAIFITSPVPSAVWIGIAVLVAVAVCAVIVIIRKKGKDR